MPAPGGERGDDAQLVRQRHDQDHRNESDYELSPAQRCAEALQALVDEVSDKHRRAVGEATCDAFQDRLRARITQAHPGSDSHYSPLCDNLRDYLVDFQNGKVGNCTKFLRSTDTDFPAARAFEEKILQNRLGDIHDKQVACALFGCFFLGVTGCEEFSGIHVLPPFVSFGLVVISLALDYWLAHQETMLRDQLTER